MGRVRDARLRVGNASRNIRRFRRERRVCLVYRLRSVHAVCEAALHKRSRRMGALGFSCSLFSFVSCVSYCTALSTACTGYGFWRFGFTVQYRFTSYSNPVLLTITHMDIRCPQEAY